MQQSNHVARLRADLRKYQLGANARVKHRVLGSVTSSKVIATILGRIGQCANRVKFFSVVQYSTTSELIGRGNPLQHKRNTFRKMVQKLRYAFYPQWNLTLSDADFYQCKVADSIVIEITIGALTEAFCALDKYGQYLRGWDSAALKLTDEPEDHLESVLTVRLTVDKDLEPKWMVVCDRHPDGVQFKQGDRNKVSVGLIGAYSEKQLSWATGTALAKLTEAQSLNELLATTSRTARASLDANRAAQTESRLYPRGSCVQNCERSGH